MFSDTSEALLDYPNGYVHLHTRVAVYAGSLNNETFTEAQNQQLLVTTVGKLVFNEILPKSFPYINEPTRENLEVKTPEKYFVEKGADVKEFIKGAERVIVSQLVRSPSVYYSGKLDKNGQRINIRIAIERRGTGELVTFLSGWMARPNGLLQMTTPYGDD